MLRSLHYHRLVKRSLPIRGIDRKRVHILDTQITINYLLASYWLLDSRMEVVPRGFREDGTRVSALVRLRSRLRRRALSDYDGFRRQADCK